MSTPASGPTESIRIGEVEVVPGYRTQVDLPIADLSIHVPMAMPVHVINGAEDGPVLFVSAAIHGDELNGVEIIRRIIKLAALRRLKGALIAVPIVNVPGFLNLSRYLPDRRDLNRSFPGSAKGSLAARLAEMFVDQILSNATHGIDLHTGAVHRENFPQIRVDLDNPAAEPMARAFGAPLVVNSASRDGSLREAADKRDVPVIVYEAGEALRFDETAIRTGLWGVIGVMEHLGMLPRQKRGSESGSSRDPARQQLGASAGQRRDQDATADRRRGRGRSAARRRLGSAGRDRNRNQIAHGRRNRGPHQPPPRPRRRRPLPHRNDGESRARGIVQALPPPVRMTWQGLD